MFRICTANLYPGWLAGWRSWDASTKPAPNTANDHYIRATKCAFMANVGSACGGGGSGGDGDRARWPVHDFRLTTNRVGVYVCVWGACEHRGHAKARQCSKRYSHMSTYKHTHTRMSNATRNEPANL